MYVRGISHYVCVTCTDLYVDIPPDERPKTSPGSSPTKRSSSCSSKKATPTSPPLQLWSQLSDVDRVKRVRILGEKIIKVNNYYYYLLVYTKFRFYFNFWVLFHYYNVDIIIIIIIIISFGDCTYTCKLILAIFVYFQEL